jgi:hypothetical protein
MRILLICLLLTGCASSKWADYNYGPGDWLSENTPLKISTMNNYAHFVEPTIEIHRVDSVSTACGTIWAQGCAMLNGDHCDIYVGKSASPDTIAHEERHCRGWDHHRPRFETFTAMDDGFLSRELKRANHWYPMDNIGNVVAVTQSSRVQK